MLRWLFALRHLLHQGLKPHLYGLPRRGMCALAALALLTSARAPSQIRPVFVDFDGDGEVSVCDSVGLATCLCGPAILAPSRDCLAAFDCDLDRDVDMRDVAQFQRFFYPAPRLLMLPSRHEVMESALLASRHWIDGHPNPGDQDWDRSACFEGIIDLYGQVAEQELYDYAVAWAESNNWSLLGGPTTRLADHHAAGQVYLELYQCDPQPIRIAEIQASIDAMVASSEDDDWYWIDAIQMALPVFARFGELYGDDAYHLKGWDLFNHTYGTQGGQGLYADNGNYTLGEYLWWRDQYFQPPRTSPNGQQIFWSRGNGWVFAGLVRALQHMQPTDSHYADYVRVFQEMAASLVTRQQPCGFWPVNLDDPNHVGDVDPSFVDCPETSGTAFFTYGMAWGIRNGYLSAGEYGPTVVAAWDALVTQALDANGRLGWCQPTGFEPESSQPFDQYRTADFGVGAFLLAASEVAQLACGPMPTPGEISIFVSEGWWAHRGFRDGNHDLGPDNSGLVGVDFDLVPYSTMDIDAVVGYADSSVSVSQFWHNFALVRLHGGVFEAYDLDGYRADAVLPVAPGATHHVSMVFDLPAETYDVWVTPPGGSPIQIANDFRFRAAAGLADDLGQVTLISTVNSGDIVVYNHTVSFP